MPRSLSPEVGPRADGADTDLRCDNCGGQSEREEAFVTVRDAEESHLPERAPEELFELDAERARAELRDPDGAIQVVDPYSDADELHRLLDDAQEKEIIRARREGAAVLVYPLPVGEPGPLLAVAPGGGPTLLGFEQKLRQDDDEGPVAFTVRVLGEMVAEANSLAAGRAADGGRLDRIAAFMNAHRPWDGGDVCEFVARELVASGRRLLDADE
jgi:hypothetical protein